MIRICKLTALAVILGLGLPACTVHDNSQSNSSTPSAPVNQSSPAPSPELNAGSSQLTLPLLDSLLSQASFVTEIKSKLQLTDDQVESLRSVASAEVKRLRETNSEKNFGDPAEARAVAFDRVSEILGDQKTHALVDLATTFSADATDGSTSSDTANSNMPKQPNAVPTDTRVVVNIPAYRMDLFADGHLLKSYKIGIGYPEFPLPQGLRKAQTVIFNPTWTPPDSPWVAKMANVSAGERVEAGSKLNPLGPIKIPIGMPSLIHGGKSPAKIGSFASHGCVGLTNAQVKDFARMLFTATSTNVPASTIASYLQNRSVTRAVKLSKAVPVELRYETIVVEDGKLHIYKDVYEENTNTKEKLQQVLAANGASFESLSESEKESVLVALNAMTAHPKKSAITIVNAKQRSPDRPKSQKEVVLEIAALGQKGYPAPVNLDNGRGSDSGSVRRNGNSR